MLVACHFPGEETFFSATTSGTFPETGVVRPFSRSLYTLWIPIYSLVWRWVPFVGARFFLEFFLPGCMGCSGWCVPGKGERYFSWIVPVEV